MNQARIEPRTLAVRECSSREKSMIPVSCPRHTMFRRYHRNIGWSILLVVAISGASQFNEAAESSSTRIDPAGIKGALVIAGGGKLPDSILDRFMKLAGGEKAHLVIVPTASARADQDEVGSLLANWKERKPASLTLLHTRDRNKASDPEFLQPLKKATAIWFMGGVQSRITAAYLGTDFEKAIAELLDRGGVIGGSSAGAAIQSHVMIAGGQKEAKLASGFDLLPGTIIDQHFVARNRQPRLIGAVAQHPQRVGLGIDEGTALIVRGRQIEVLGRSTVTVCLAGSATHPATQVKVPAGRPLDLTALRRSARDRQQPAFPPATLQPCRVSAGSLLIVGGGGFPMPMREKFIELAGGPDALIIVLPTAQEDPLPRQVGQKMFEDAGARNVQVLRARQLADVESKATQSLLEKAGGIWFGGGRQWRFVDAYEGTSALPHIRAVLQRGGVIGGSSAGASIQAEYLVRGNPLGNRDMMAAGYERGFGFLPGAAIDQHFAQRRRFPDMTRVMTRHPQLLGIGIDESTALLVQGSTGLVMGKGQVHIYNWREPPRPGQPDHQSFPLGSRYDLVNRKALFVPEKDEPEKEPSSDR